MDSELLTTNSNSAPVVPAVEVAPAAAAAVDSLDGGALKKCNSYQYRHEETKRCRKYCKTGQVLDPETKRCRNSRSPKPCKEGKVRSRKSNYCVKIRPCKEGKARDEETGRCVKIRPCKEGKVRDSVTKRCRKSRSRSPCPSKTYRRSDGSCSPRKVRKDLGQKRAPYRRRQMMPRLSGFSTDDEGQFD